MRYNGSIVFSDDPSSWYSYIQWLDHSAKMGNLYMLMAEGYSWDYAAKPFVYIHNAANLVFKSKIPLEKYYVGNNQTGMTEYEPMPYFVFSNSTGDEIVVVTKAQGSGLEKEWAIEKIMIND